MLTEDRISHLAHLLQDRVWKDDLVDYPDEGAALREVKRVLSRYLATTQDIDETVRQKIYSQKRRIVEGSQEWDIIYQKYFEEEMSKRQF
jgi:uncharacterized protein